MSLRFGQYTIAGIECTGISLQPWLGGYSLEVALRFRPEPKPNLRFRASNLAIQLNLAPAGQIVPVCRMESLPQNPLTIEQYSSDDTRIFRAPLNLRQLAALEDARDGQDLSVRLDVYGYVEQAGEARTEPAYHNLFHTVPVSQWVKTLSSSGYQAFIHFDLSSGQTSSRTWTLLARAQELFTKGHYREAVGSCRKVMEVVAESLPQKDRDAAKNGYKTKATDMDQRQRFILIQEAIRHALHLANHDHDGDGEDGDTDYSRQDAEFALRLAATCAAYEMQ